MRFPAWFNLFTTTGLYRFPLKATPAGRWWADLRGSPRCVCVCFYFSATHYHRDEAAAHFAHAGRREPYYLALVDHNKVIRARSPRSNLACIRQSFQRSHSPVKLASVRVYNNSIKKELCGFRGHSTWCVVI